jgi:hypothetical protein
MATRSPKRFDPRREIVVAQIAISDRPDEWVRGQAGPEPAGGEQLATGVRPRTGWGLGEFVASIQFVLAAEEGIVALSPVGHGTLEIGWIETTLQTCANEWLHRSVPVR